MFTPPAFILSQKAFVLQKIFHRLLNSGFRRLNRSRSVFPNDMSLLKALYLASHELTKKWTLPVRNWGAVYNELAIMYPGRLSDT